jgi:hypothetical protein
MAALASELVYTVQDLYDLFQRHNPLGGFRHSLFHETPTPKAALPPAVAADCRLAYSLARGVSCLLANGLPEAALALAAALWRHVREQERVLVGDSWREPDYYRFLTAEFAQPASDEASTPSQAYCMFGEVLAVQLDLLALWLEEQEGAALRQRVARLRRELHR